MAPWHEEKEIFLIWRNHNGCSQALLCIAPAAVASTCAIPAYYLQPTPAHPDASCPPTRIQRDTGGVSIRENQVFSRADFPGDNRMKNQSCKKINLMERKGTYGPVVLPVYL